MWWGVVWFGGVWCGVVGCGGVWCGVVECSVVWWGVAVSAFFKIFIYFITVIPNPPQKFE